MNRDKLYLVGFMGAGKTTVARALGRRLGWRVEDIDERIEARERRSVAAIFAQHGEPYFRQLERQVLVDLLPERKIVVATGGGTFAEADNRALMLADGAVAWLDIPLAQRAASACPPTAGGRWRRTGSRWSSCYARRQLTYARRTCASTAPSRSRSRGPPARMDRLLMRYLILSDIHANLEALEAVLAAADRSWTRCWCSAIWSATARIPTRSSTRAGPAGGGDRPGQPRQGRPPGWRASTASTTWRATRSVDHRAP